MKDSEGRYFATKGLDRKRGMLRDSSFIVSTGESILYHIRDTTIVKKMPLPIEALIYQIDSDEGGNVWVCTSQGVLFYKDGDISNVPSYFLKGIGVASVFQDNEGCYWITTLDEGIFFVPIFAFSSLLGDLDQEIGRITALEAGVSKLWVGSFRGKIYHLDSSEYTLNRHFELFVKKSYVAQQKPIADIMVSNNRKGNIYFSNMMYTDRSGKVDFFLRGATHPLLKRLMGLASTKFIGERRYGEGLLLGTSSSAFIINGNSVFHLNEPPINIEGMTTYAMLELDSNRFWLGTKSGVYELDLSDSSLVSLGERSELFTRRVRTMKYGPDGVVYIGTKGNGVVIAHGDQVFQVSSKEGLSSDIVATLLVQNDSILWAGGPKGLNRITLDLSKNTVVRVENFMTEDGLPFNEILDLAMFQDEIFIANDKYLLSFDPNEIDVNKQPPYLNITNISINNQVVAYQAQYQLVHDQNNISITYQAISPRSGNKLKYKYRLIGQDSTWVTTKERNIQFTNLEAGQYRFEVIATNKDGYSTPNPITIAFEIDRHYTETWWFTVLKLIGIVLCVGGVFYYLYYRFKKQNEIEKNMLKSRFTTLLSQMNPHFLFNSLASIQRYIMENDRKNANYYLSRFSTLIRQVLENSEKGVVLIEDELEQLESYLELEKLRFRGQFDYKIEIDDALDIWGYKMPTMILQPFIENAIWHGLSQKLEGGLLTISLRPAEQSERIILSVIDNGVGRERSLKKKHLNRKKHKSIGLKNVAERIKLINSLHQINMEHEIQDLYDENKEPAGTAVLVYMDMLQGSKK